MDVALAVEYLQYIDAVLKVNFMKKSHSEMPL